MKTFIITVVLFVLLLSGCAKVLYEKTMPDGTMIKIAYERCGNQSIGRAVGNPDGSFELEGQESDNESAYKAINKLVDKLP